MGTPLSIYRQEVEITHHEIDEVELGANQPPVA
jgi:hypothetical protein